ncbi:unnamed protein product [Pieris macdunnoughi]|uniref:Uncharacterized protein n=1 Tax=Pieris macdunnoughi TaxID=345717 RepID=A0A821W758_9NEOP|nr:unnamed protein product [Pieris macdunnoughi]
MGRCVAIGCYVLSTSKLQILKQFVKKSAVPTLFSWNSASGQDTSARAERLNRRNVKRCLIPSTVTENYESVVDNNTAVSVTNDSTDQGYAHEVEISSISDENSER